MLSDHIIYDLPNKKSGKPISLPLVYVFSFSYAPQDICIFESLYIAISSLFWIGVARVYSAPLVMPALGYHRIEWIVKFLHSIPYYDTLQFHFKHKEEITSASVRILPATALYSCSPLHCDGVVIWQRSQAIYSIFEPLATLSSAALPPQNGHGCNFIDVFTIIFKNSFQITWQPPPSVLY